MAKIEKKKQVRTTRRKVPRKNTSKSPRRSTKNERRFVINSGRTKASKVTRPGKLKRPKQRVLHDQTAGGTMQGVNQKPIDILKLIGWAKSIPSTATAPKVSRNVNSVSSYPANQNTIPPPCPTTIPIPSPLPRITRPAPFTRLKKTKGVRTRTDETKLDPVAEIQLGLKDKIAKRAKLTKRKASPVKKRSTTLSQPQALSQGGTITSASLIPPTPPKFVASFTPLTSAPITIYGKDNSSIQPNPPLLPPPHSKALKTVTKIRPATRKRKISKTADPMSEMQRDVKEKRAKRAATARDKPSTSGATIKSIQQNFAAERSAEKSQNEDQFSSRKDFDHENQKAITSKLCSVHMKSKAVSQPPSSNRSEKIDGDFAKVTKVSDPKITKVSRIERSHKTWPLRKQVKANQPRLVETSKKPRKRLHSDGNLCHGKPGSDEISSIQRQGKEVSEHKLKISDHISETIPSTKQHGKQTKIKGYGKRDIPVITSPKWQGKRDISDNASSKRNRRQHVHTASCRHNQDAIASSKDVKDIPIKILSKRSERHIPVEVLSRRHTSKPTVAKSTSSTKKSHSRSTSRLPEHEVVVSDKSLKLQRCERSSDLLNKTKSWLTKEHSVINQTKQTHHSTEPRREFSSSSTCTSDANHPSSKWKYSRLNDDLGNARPIVKDIRVKSSASVKAGHSQGQTSSGSSKTCRESSKRDLGLMASEDKKDEHNCKRNSSNSITQVPVYGLRTKGSAVHFVRTESLQDSSTSSSAVPKDGSKRMSEIKSIEKKNPPKDNSSSNESQKSSEDSQSNEQKHHGIIETFKHFLSSE